MNLKEAFRYQNFLNSLMKSAARSITAREHSMTTTRTHNKKKFNQDAEDMVEQVVPEVAFAPNDDVIRFMGVIITERLKLSEAITNAKHTIAFDIDAAVEANKFRQLACAAIKTMLQYQGCKTTQAGKDYKFNSEGNQMPYFYEIECVSKEAFDRDAAKVTMRSMVSEADSVSAEIDAAMVNTQVNYIPPFDVNEEFDDIIADFVQR